MKLKNYNPFVQYTIFPLSDQVCPCNSHTHTNENERIEKKREGNVLMNASESICKKKRDEEGFTVTNVQCPGIGICECSK
jgi:predicted metal-binding protein